MIGYGYLILFSILSYLLYASYRKGHHLLVKENYTKLKLLYSMFNSFNAPDSPEIKVHKSNFVISDSDKSAIITYERFKTEYMVIIPYNRRYVSKMMHLKVEIKIEDDKFLEITQQPGIPYLVSAEMLGGKEIKISNTDTGQVHIYQGNEIPGYGIEVFE